MEAAALSSVVSMTLKVVANKLAPLLIKEYTSIAGVKRDLEELRDQVEEINGWLETRYEAVWNDPSFNWLKRFKDVTYAVDDVVDEFQLKAEKHGAAADGGGIISKYVCTKPKSFILQCNVAIKIKKIKRRFAEIVKQRIDYNAITNSISVDPPIRQTNMRTGGMSSWPDVDVSSVVGRDEDKKHIISKLQETDHQLKIKIISVIGLGGSGKTALAKLIFNDGSINKHFDITLWIHVSQEFVVDKLVKNMFEAFADNDPGQHGMPYMRKTISDKLLGKRFLLVLDDVWTESQFQWKEFREFLINIGAPGSRILLTTRSSKVAETVGSTDQFLLPLLSKASSWELFIESCGMAANDLDSEFHDVGKEIVDKFGGVPLAIKVVAGVLHGKEQIDQWKAIRDNNLLYVEGEEHRVAACLRLSYFHLSSNLKQCFIICSVFPKGHEIDKEQLIDLWIAHDIISVEDSFDYLNLEHVGEKHFNSLLEMNFLLNVKTVYGKLMCGMHDLVHDLALSIVRDEISFGMPNDATSITKSYRYFSLVKQPKNLVPKNIFKKARAVYMHQFRDCTNYVMALKHAKHLCSVMVNGYLDAKEANTISQVKYLKYLAISLRSCEMLPEGISNVWSLQALYVTQSFSLVKIPESICKLKMLRTLNLSDCFSLKSLPDSIGDCQMISSIALCSCKRLTVLPDSIGKLQRLRTLNLTECTMLESLPYSIGDCQMISSIDLCNCEWLKVLPDSIGKLQKLRTLNLSRCTYLKCLPDTIGDCKMISSIDLFSCEELTRLPDSIGRNEKLRFLRLGETNIFWLPSSITKLRNLECLDLQSCQLVELPEGICNFEKLQVLNLKDCKNLKGMPLGIGQLSRLQKLGLFVVGKGEEFAGISELANVSRIGDKLRISGISHVSDLNDAHMACLKQKTNLQRLNLDWMVNNKEKLNTKFDRTVNGAEEVNTKLLRNVLDGLQPPPPRINGLESLCTKLNKIRDGMDQVGDKLEQDVLDGLEPPPGIKELEIHFYPGRQLALWMQNEVGGGVRGSAPFPFLRVMMLHNFQNLKHLHGLVELPCSEELKLIRMPSLESISGGPFPSLVKLEMNELPCLGEVWMIAGRTMPDGEVDRGCCNFTPQLGQVRVGDCLAELVISDCPKLEVKPHLPLSLQHLELRASEQLLQSPGQCQGSASSTSFSHLKKLELYSVRGLGSRNGWELLQHMTALESLQIHHFSGVQTELPESLWSLTALRSLIVHMWSDIRVLPESLGELRSLQELTIISCGRLSMLPQSIGQLTSLRTLDIRCCDALHQLPDCLGELCYLHRLEIRDLPGLTCLPQSISCLTTSLQDLEIYGCPGIKSLPEWIKDLKALKRLWIQCCPDLERRCKEGIGEDWHLISHIPDMRRDYCILICFRVSAKPSYPVIA